MTTKGETKSLTRRRVPHRSAGPLWLAMVGLVAALAIASVVSVPARFAQLATECQAASCQADQLGPTEMSALRTLGIPVGLYAGYLTSLEAVISIGFVGVAGAILWRRPDDRVALLAAFVLATLGVTAAEIIVADPVLGPAARLVVASGYVAVVIFLAVFPDGRFVPLWTLPVVAVWSVWRLSLVAFPPGGMQGFGIVDPYRVLVTLGGFALGVVAQIIRYRTVSTPTQRQQTKWVVFGSAVSVLGVTSYFLQYAMLVPLQVGAGESRVLYLLVDFPIYSLAMLAGPMAIALSIGRRRLWDIDLIINRALVYGLLTAGLAVVYFVAIVGLQTILVALTGERSDLAVAASTLAIAALFSPLRGGVQVAVDRRFYRRKYDAMKVLGEIGASVREEVDLDRLTDRLVDSVDEAIQPSDVRIWLVRQSGIRGTGR
jgi:hypothetical protein